MADKRMTYPLKEFSRCSKAFFSHGVGAYSVKENYLWLLAPTNGHTKRLPLIRREREKDRYKTTKGIWPIFEAYPKNDSPRFSLDFEKNILTVYKGA